MLSRERIVIVILEGLLANVHYIVALLSRERKATMVREDFW